MIVQMLITCILTGIEIIICGFPLPMFLRFLSRVSFILKFQGLNIAPVVLYILEGSGLVFWIAIDMVFNKGDTHWGQTLVMLIVSAGFILQIIIEENIYITTDMTEDEYNQLKELGKK